MLNDQIPGDTSELVFGLKDGVILCNLANVFAKGVIKKIHSVKSGSVLGFMATDNISSFYKAIDSVNFNKTYWFGVVDLWEMKNIRNVVGCLHALARYVGTLGDYVKIKDLSKTKQEFKEKEINETKKILEELDAKEDPKNKVQLFPNIQEDIPEEIEEEEQEVDLANPDECLVEGDGSKEGFAGVESKFIIIARDTLGNELEKGGEKFTVMLFHKNK